MERERRRRGRPRPPDVISRDKRIPELITDHPQTSDQLVRATGFDKQAVYLSLRRLFLAGVIIRQDADDRDRILRGAERKNIWKATAH